MRLPTDVTLLQECVERAYEMMCGISSSLGEHTHKQTRKMISRQLALLGKLLGEIRRQMRVHTDISLLTDKQTDMLEVITKVYRIKKTTTRVEMRERVSQTGL